MIPKMEFEFMKDFKVGVDSYSIKWLNLSPFELLEWAKNNGADGVHFTELNLNPENAIATETQRHRENIYKML